MMLVLDISLAALLVTAFLLGKNDLLSPSVLFTLGFLVCALWATCFQRTWDFELHTDTYLVIVSGILIFILVATCAHCIYRHICNARIGRSDGTEQKFAPLTYNAVFVYLVIIVQLVAFVWTLRHISTAFLSDSITGSINLYDQANKFGSTVVEPLPRLLSILRNFCTASSLLLLFQLVQNLANRIRQGVLPLLMVFIMSCAMSLEMGGRAGTVGNICYFGIMYLFFKARMSGGTLRISVAKIASAFAIVAVVLVAFQASLKLMGRTSTQSFFEYLAIYLGAQIPNLDAFLQGSFPKDHGVFGYMTFIFSIRWFGQKLGIDDWVYQLDLPFMTANGHGMGNVYTTFYAPIYDFGYLGILIAIPIIALVSQLIYEKAMRSARASSCIWIILYVLTAYALLMSFFSNKFFEDILVIGTIRTFIYIIMCYLLYTRLTPGRLHVSVLSPAREYAIDQRVLYPIEPRRKWGFTIRDTRRPFQLVH